MYQFQIQEFLGIQQQGDGSLLPSGSASDCRNMSTLDGNLSVCKGYAKHIFALLPGNDRILKLIASRGATISFYVVTANNIYAYSSGAWASIFTFSPALDTEQVDYIQTQIGNDDYIIVATGCSQMVKIKLSDGTASAFGTGAYSFSGTVSSYNSSTKVVTLSTALSADALRHAPIDGIIIAEKWHKVENATGLTVTLSEAPDTSPASADVATIRGGGSDAHCNYLDIYYGRLFSAGDPDNPCRLYWSAVPGDGRTFEDWLSVDGSADASGGFVEVGDSSGDSIVGIVVLATEMLIFKRYSVYRMYGDRPTSYAVERVENFSEHVSNASVIVKYNVPYYITASGLKYYDGTGILPMHEGVRYLHSFLPTINSVRQSKGVHSDNVLYFSCKVDSSSTYDDTIIVYDIARYAFTIRNGFQIADMVQSDGHLYLVNDNRYVYEFNKGDDYDGVNIDAYWETQITDLASKLFKKQITDVLLRGNGGDFAITITSGSNKVTEHKRWSKDTENGNVLIVPVSVDLASSFRIRLENEAGSRFSITGGLDVLFAKEVKIR